MGDRGVTLVEVVVATTLLLVGFTGLARLSASAVASLTAARALDEAQIALTATVDSLSSVGASGSGGRQVGRGDLSWSVPAGPAEPASVRYAHPDLRAAIELRYLTRSRW